MAEQARFGQRQGIARGIVQKNGDLVRLAPDGPEKSAKRRVGRLVLDGDVILPADGADDERAAQARRPRTHLKSRWRSTAGPASPATQITLQGIPIEEDRDEFLAEARARPTTIAKSERKQDKLREAIRLAVRRRATDWTGKKPVVDVLIVRWLNRCSWTSLLAIYILFWTMSLFVVCRSVSAHLMRQARRWPGHAESAPHVSSRRAASRATILSPPAVWPLLMPITSSAG